MYSQLAAFCAVVRVDAGCGRVGGVLLFCCRRKSSRSRRSALYSLGEHVKQYAVLGDCSLEPCPEGGIAPPLLDLLNYAGVGRF